MSQCQTPTRSHTSMTRWPVQVWQPTKPHSRRWTSTRSYSARTSSVQLPWKQQAHGMAWPLNSFRTHHSHHWRYQGNGVSVPAPAHGPSTGERGQCPPNESPLQPLSLIGYLRPQALCWWANNNNNNNNNNTEGINLKNNNNIQLFVTTNDSDNNSDEFYDATTRQPTEERLTKQYTVVTVNAAK